MVFDLIIVGAGAAGFFAANQVLEQHPEANILMLEKGTRPLDKVRISGGGRCNVTHACFDPKELVKFYPRGEKELLGPFHKFQPGDTIAWFEEKSVELKIESDGRMFPTTDQSATIMEALQRDVVDKGVKLNLSNGVRSFAPHQEGWELRTNQDTLITKHLLLAPGSSKPLWQVLEQLGHTIIPPVPSLFTFNCTDQRIKDLPGVVAQEATLKIAGSKFEEFGPLLVTHWGMSGPGILKLSARAARYLAETDYDFEVQINWTSQDLEEVFETLCDCRDAQPGQLVQAKAPLALPSRLWKSLCAHAQMSLAVKWGDLNNKRIRAFSQELTQAKLQVKGKSTYKDEFVTAGGIDLKEVDFKHMESKAFPNLYFAGEVLNIDALTGGFNFQAAWTTAYLAGRSIADRL